MDRCAPDCPSPKWSAIAFVRLWTVEQGVLLATVYESRACRACSALAFRAWLVDAVVVA